jgi:hypothetical protein
MFKTALRRLAGLTAALTITATTILATATGASAAPPAPTITAPAQLIAPPGVVFDFAFPTTDATDCAITAGTLPNTVTATYADNVCDVTGTIGQPIVGHDGAGTYPFTLTVTGPGGTGQIDTSIFATGVEYVPIVNPTVAAGTLLAVAGFGATIIVVRRRRRATQLIG